MEDTLRLWAPLFLSLIAQFFYLSAKFGQLVQRLDDLGSRLERVERFIDQFAERRRS
jgi:hypothetical protein